MLDHTREHRDLKSLSVLHRQKPSHQKAGQL